MEFLFNCFREKILKENRKQMQTGVHIYIVFDIRFIYLQALHFCF